MPPESRESSLGRAVPDNKPERPYPDPTIEALRAHGRVSTEVEPQSLVAVAMFPGNDQWYTLSKFIDPEAGRPTGWVEATAGVRETAAGGRVVWIDLAMVYTVFVYDHAAMLAEWAARQEAFRENWTKMRP